MEHLSQTRQRGESRHYFWVVVHRDGTGTICHTRGAATRLLRRAPTATDAYDFYTYGPLPPGGLRIRLNGDDLADAVTHGVREIMAG